MHGTAQQMVAIYYYYAVGCSLSLSTKMYLFDKPPCWLLSLKNNQIFKHVFILNEPNPNLSMYKKIIEVKIQEAVFTLYPPG